jgi:hypothetical protein
LNDAGVVTGPANTPGDFSVAVGVEDKTGVKASRTLVFHVSDN